MISDSDPDEWSAAFVYTREQLARVGPFIPITWSVSTKLRQACERAGRPVPAPVSGACLIDTGAQGTHLSEEVVTSLVLRSLGRCRVNGIHGPGEADRYIANLTLHMPTPRGDADVFLENRGVIGGPDLSASYEDLRLRIDGQASRVLGVLGRDILSKMRFLYDGKNGGFEIQWSGRDYRTVLRPAP